MWVIWQNFVIQQNITFGIKVAVHFFLILIVQVHYIIIHNVFIVIITMTISIWETPTPQCLIYIS